MLSKDNTFKLIELLLTCDDFCKALTEWQKANGCLPRSRAAKLSDSEMLTIVIFYHYSGYKCFQYYYQSCVELHLKSYFPTLISYERFVARMPRLLPGLFVLLHWLSAQSQHTGFYIIDSKDIKACP